jgi:hypothetical protein
MWLQKGELKPKFERWMHILKYGKTYCGGRQTPRWVRYEEEIAMALDQLTKVNANAATGNCSNSVKKPNATTHGS